jgi:hypothetical protein
MLVHTGHGVNGCASVPARASPRCGPADAHARAKLAAPLLASLEGPTDPDAGAAWDAEIERRVAAIEAGTMRLEPWDTVKRRIEKETLGR